MTKTKMIQLYRKHSASDSYIIGFTYKHSLYMIEIDEIMPRHMQLGYSSSKKGHEPKLRLILNNKLKEQFIRKGAICLGSEDLVNGEYSNKGVEFEKLVYELNNQVFRGKDNIGFWVAGDITINNKEVQIKFQGAQIVTEKTLKNLEKRVDK